MRPDKSRKIESAKKTCDEHSRDIMNGTRLLKVEPLNDFAHLKCRLWGE